MENKDSGKSAKSHGLGRGLSALLGSDAVELTAAEKTRAPREVPIELLRPNRYQPRRHFEPEALDELVESIREKGILQPILVRRAGEGPDQYEIIAGERRWRAAQKAKLHKVPVVIKDMTDSEALEVAIIENIQRADLTPLEEARGYDQLMQEFGHTQEQLSQIVGKSRSHVANMLRLLTLPKDVQDMLGDGRLSMGHARALITAENPSALAAKIVQDNLSVRATETLARQVKPKSARKGGGRPAVRKDADTLALEEDLSASLGLKVEVNDRGDGSGEVRILYSTLEQLDEICRRLCQERRPA